MAASALRFASVSPYLMTISHRRDTFRARAMVSHRTGLDRPRKALKMQVSQRKWKGKDGKAHSYWRMDFVNPTTGQRERKQIPGVVSKTEAVAAASMLFSEMQKRAAMGEAAGPTLAEKALTLKALLEADNTRTGIAENTRRNEAKLRKQLLAGFGETIRVLALNPQTIERYKKGRIGAGIGPVTINHELTLLAGALSRARRGGRLCRVPVKIDKLPAPESEKRFLHVDELDALLKACHRFGIHEAVSVLANTGLRPCELERMCWRDVDLEAGVLRLLTSKRGSGATIRRDHVPLNESALAVVRGRAETAALASGLDRPDPAAKVFQPPPKGQRPGRLKQGQDAPAFETLPRNFSRTFKLAVKAAKLRDPASISPYTLRHSFATLALESGASVKVVQSLLRHRTPTLTLNTYAHAADSSARSAVGRLGIGVARVLDIPISDVTAQDGHTIEHEATDAL